MSFETFDDAGTNLKKLILPSTLTEFDSRSPASLEEFAVAPENTHFRAVDGILYTADMQCLFMIPSSIRLEEYVFPESVTSTGFDATLYLSNVKRIRISRNISPDELRFRRSTGLEEVIYPSDGTQTYIREGTFEDCISLRRVVLPDALKQVGTSAFIRCASLKTLDLPNGLEAIDDFAFSDTKIEELHLPASVNILSGDVFTNTPSLKRLYVERIPSVYSKYMFDGRYMSEGQYDVTIIGKGAEIEAFARELCCAFEEAA